MNFNLWPFKGNRFASRFKDSEGRGTACAMETYGFPFSIQRFKFVTADFNPSLQPTNTVITELDLSGKRVINWKIYNILIMSWSSFPQNYFSWNTRTSSTPTHYTFSVYEANGERGVTDSRYKKTSGVLSFPLLVEIFGMV